MRYQLVLQFKGDTLADYDEMIALEKQLIDAVGTTAEVDGHDCGSGESNIFIFTADPEATFSAIRDTLQLNNKLDFATVAYRETNGERYSVLWPPDSTTKFRIA